MDQKPTPPNHETQTVAPASLTPPTPPVSSPLSQAASPQPRHFSRKLALLLLLIIAVVFIIGSFNTYNYFANENAFLAPTPSATVKTTPTMTIDSTASWKTYSNTDYSFSLKIPADWTQSKTEIASQVNFDAPPTSECAPPNVCGGQARSLSIKILENPNSLPLNEYIKKYKSGWLSYTNFISGSPLSNIPTDWLIDRNVPSGGGHMEILIPHKKNIINVTCMVCTDELINQVLSTFKFFEENKEENKQILLQCKPGGCSGQICEDANAEPMMSTCEYKDEYACYKTATCERQSDGKCGWTQTSELTSCLQNARNE